MSKNQIVGISCGDLNGIGLEVIIKALEHKKVTELFTPVIYCSGKAVSYYKKSIKRFDFQFHIIKDIKAVKLGTINVLNCLNEDIRIEPGNISDNMGRLSYLSLEAACEDLKNNQIHSLVTAPIYKKTFSKNKQGFSGHTEYLANFFGVEEVLMILASENLRVGTITGHIAIEDVSKTLSKELIIKKINILNESLKKDFGIDKPKIALLGLNPHAGDEGLFGKEEIEIINPAIEEARAANILAFGSYPADGFFGNGDYKKFDGILSMYHDQGLVPFKTLSFGQGVNFTAGLPVIRTSPDHGTAFDIAGKNKADAASLRTAIYQALDIYQNRTNYIESHKNPVKRH